MKKSKKANKKIKITKKGEEKLTPEQKNKLKKKFQIFLEGLEKINL